ncbi:PPE family protein [Nocardia sp. NPDC059180]|uniref:PPE family protein n=1 Tax=Nocardia sp. NPDC059180 TaxID=3346761 RepID=UPI00369E2614
MPFYGALPPLLMSINLNSGPGPLPMLYTAKSYLALAESLAIAAGSSDAHTAGLAGNWGGDSALKAQGAYRRHTEWLRQQSELAALVAERSFQQAAAYTQARATMPPPAVIAANRVAMVGLATTNGMGQNTAALAANEAAYMTMWAIALETMMAYEAESLANAASLPPAPPAPQITSAPGVGGGGPLNLLPGGGGGSQDGFGGGPGDGGGGGGRGPDGRGPNQGPGAGDPGTGGPSDPGSGGSTDPGTGGPGTSDTPPTTGGNGPADSLPGEGQLPPTDSMTGPETLGDMPFSGPDGLVDPSIDPAFFGTSPQSSTLDGLTGGVGSTVALGLARGGLGGMPGAATGFRMPANWALRAPGATFGAPVTPAGAPPARNMPPRGAIAPNARRRRRDREEYRKPAAVYTPGEPQEVPVLEKPPAIGVIEYHDDDTTSQHKEVLGEPVRG